MGVNQKMTVVDTCTLHVVNLRQREKQVHADSNPCYLSYTTWSRGQLNEQNPVRLVAV